MSAFLDKVGNFFFGANPDNGNPEEERQADIPTEQAEPAKKTATAKKEEKAAPSGLGKGMGKIVSVPAKGMNADNTEIILFKATSYDDMQEIAQHIRDRKVAVVNFDDMDKDIAQRMVDFLSGAAFALGGKPRKVSSATFIFSSSQVGISGQIISSGTGFNDVDDINKDMRFSSEQWLNH